MDGRMEESRGGGRGECLLVLIRGLQPVMMPGGGGRADSRLHHTHTHTE